MPPDRGPAFAARYLAEWFLRPSRLRGRPARPTVLNLPITDNCNSRCVMCDVWKTKSTDELSPADLGVILADDLFHDVRHAGLSGGEPSLRRDLVECVTSVVDSLPALRSLSLTTHGFHTARWESFLPGIAAACGPRRIGVRLNLSLDGVGQIHDGVRGIPGGYGRVLGTLRAAREAGVRVVLQSTLSRQNAFAVVHLLDVATTELGVELQVRVATDIARLDNSESIRRVALTARQRSFVADLLESEALRAATPSPARRLLYQDLAARLAEQGNRTAPCFYQSEGILLTVHGDLYHCSMSSESVGNALHASAADLYFSAAALEIRRKLMQEVCPRCMHDQSGAWTPAALAREMIFGSRVGRRVSRVARATGTLLVHAPAVASARLVGKPKGPVPSGVAKAGALVCMGMYGGEHVGDAAILGGVLNRMARRYGASRAFVLSFRPHRTRRWVGALDLPLQVDVLPYTEMQRALSGSTRLVLAGGPVMDIPTVLLREIKVALAARRRGMPFHVEGVGIGPLESLLGGFLADTLLRLADSVDVRSGGAARHPIVRRFRPTVSSDPAIEYASSRSMLDRIDPEDASRLQGILSDPEELKVAVNLRPLWRRYGVSGDVRRAESSFLEAFAGGMAAFRRDWTGPVRFVFLPMNADQYGFSDLEMAYRLGRHLPSNFPFSVFETEPDVDAALALLRRVDLAVMMRLHACVFAMAQKVPMLGLDYSFGRPGKVVELFADAGNEERVCRVDQFQPTWLAGQLAALAEGSRAQRGRAR